jgi:NADPH:quinone reductase-like Zn-dependent oxidoreductase
MKAAVQSKYGSPDAITIEDRPKPVPADDQVLIRIHAATVGIVDTLARKGEPAYARVAFGLRRPRHPVLGSDFAGQVEAVGASVTRFTPGDQVFGTSAPNFGAHCEYLCLPETAALAHKPASLSYAEAAALVDATALSFLRDHARLSRGHAIAINGASGSVGSTAVQLAVDLGATVTGICSGVNAGVVRKLGAEKVIDYTTTDFAKAGQTFDVIFDVAGKSSFGHCRKALNPGGIYLTTAPSPALFAQMAWTAKFGRRKAAIAFTGLRPAAEKLKDLDRTSELVEAGALTAVIDECFPLDRIGDAHRRVEAGRKAGNIVVLMEAPN